MNELIHISEKKTLVTVLIKLTFKNKLKAISTFYVSEYRKSFHSKYYENQVISFFWMFSDYFRFCETY